MQVLVFIAGVRAQVIVQHGVDVTPNQVMEALKIDKIWTLEHTPLDAIYRRVKDFENEFLRRSADVLLLIPSFEGAYHETPKADEWWDYGENRPFHFPTWLVVRGGPTFPEVKP